MILKDYLKKSAFFDLEDNEDPNDIYPTDMGSIRTFVRLSDREGEYACSWRCDERYDAIRERIELLLPLEE